MLTAIYHQLTSSIPQPLSQSIAVEPYFKDPVYYLLIYPPQNYNQLGMLGEVQRYILPEDLRLKIQLAPSVGYGFNSCYLVHYYLWQEVEGIPGAPKARPRNQLLRKEYWRVPTRSGEYLATIYDKPNLKEPLITTEMTRTAEDVDRFTPEQHSYFAVKSITQGETTYTEYQLTPSGIQWGVTAPEVDTTYKLTSYQPLDLTQIIYLEESKDIFWPDYSRTC